MEKNFQSLNHFSHRDLYRFGMRLLEEYQTVGAGYKEALAMRVKLHVKQYGSLIEKINEKSIALLLDDFDARRYKLWEQIVSFLDKQLQVQLSPFDKDWDGKTSETHILKHIPSYKSAHLLLNELCPEFTHYGRKVYGYVYSRHEMDLLIDAMQSAPALRAVQALALEDKVGSYQEVKKAFDFCIQKYGYLKHHFDELSCVRVKVCLGLMLVLHKIPGYARKYPPPREVSIKGISPLLVNRDELVGEVQSFSFNDFSHGSLLVLAQRMLDAGAQRLEEGHDVFPLTAELEKQVSIYKGCLKTIHSEEGKHSFDQQEGRRYRLFELLVSTIEQHMHGDAEWSTNEWVRHGCTPRYEAAEFLLYDTCDDYCHDFNPDGNGHLCKSSVMDELIQSWADFEAQTALRKLDCIDMYNQYRECAAQCESDAWKLERTIGTGVTSNIRVKRYEISLLLSIAARHLGNNTYVSAKNGTI